MHVAHSGSTSIPTEPPPLRGGTTCLLLHTAGGSAGTWRPVTEAFDPGCPWVALDAPAHGRSGGIVGPADLAAYADLVADMLAWLARPSVVLVGWGLGGAAALAVVRRSVPGVRGVVLVGLGAPTVVPAPLLATLRDVVCGRRPQHFGTEGFAPGTDLDVMRLAWAEQVRTDPRVWLADLETLAGLDVAALAEDARLPALVVTGAHDRFATPEAARVLAASLPGARVEVVEDAGHQLPVERPERLVTLVSEFVEGLS